MSRYARIAYTDAVQQVQRERQSWPAQSRALATDEGPQPFTGQEAEFVSGLDGFYLASVSETGWPYVQYRGGPPGFVHVIDPERLAFADVRGNRQYLTSGNVRGDDRVALFFMDYASTARLKVFGHAQLLGPADDPELTRVVSEPRTDGQVEAVMVIRIEAHSWNCQKHITPRFSLDELAESLAPIRERIARLEAENAQLRRTAASVH